jgi:anti-sigma-K factor RskA
MSGQRPGGDGDCGGNAAPYVLGALTDAEHEAFLAHLATCAVCREEVAALQMVASSLPATAPQLVAPPELKRRVMAEVRGEAREREAAARSTERRPRARTRWRPVLVPAAVGVAVVALLAIVLAGGGGGGTRVIRAQVTAPGASGSVRVSGGHAELTLSGMPQVRRGRVYELWIKRSGAPEPTDALFTVSSRGDATVGVPGSVTGVRVLMVTSEPLGGSRTPTSAPTVVAQLG